MIDPTEILESETQKFVRGLRELANMYEAYPGIPLPLSCSLCVYNASPLQLVGVAKAQGARKTEKRYIGDAFYLEKHFSGDVSLVFYATREQVCRKVVKEVRHVPETIEPEKVVPAKVIPAHDEEVIEWECQPLLAPPSPKELEAAIPEADYDAVPF